MKKIRLSGFLLGKKKEEMFVGRARLNYYTRAKLIKRIIFNFYH